MTKRSHKPIGGKGKQASPELHRKRGFKTVEQRLEPMVRNFMHDIPPPIRDRVYGWESEILDTLDSQDDKASTDMQTVSPDPGHTRGRTSLYQQSIRTYWVIKCLLAKAIMSLAEPKLDFKLEAILVDINRNVQEINLRQLNQYTRLASLEKEIKALQQVPVELPGATATAPAPVESDED